MRESNNNDRLQESTLSKKQLTKIKKNWINADLKDSAFIFTTLRFECKVSSTHFKREIKFLIYKKKKQSKS